MTAIDTRGRFDPRRLDPRRSGEAAPPPAAGAVQQPRVRERAETPVGVRVMTWTLGGVAVLGAWLVLFGLVLSGLTEAHAQHGLYAQFRQQLALGTAPLGGAIREGAPVAVVTARSAGLDGVVVSEGTSSTVLRNGPGHYPGDPLPGQPGVTRLLGRSTSYGAPFADVTHAHKGDTIKVTTGQGSFTYVVEDVRRKGDPFPPALAAGGSQLTLITSEGSGWQSGWAPGNVVFVDAVLKGAAVSAPPGVSVPTSVDKVMATDSRGLYPLILWLQLLLVAGVAGVWTRQRWGLWQTWLVAGPILLAALWGASGSLWRILPNLL
jgi:sortase A